MWNLKERGQKIKGRKYVGKEENMNPQQLRMY